MRKEKIFNDPVYGFINIPNELAFSLINHPYFQRLRHISQLGLSSLVYPCAQHTRFSHAIGAMHLMTLAIDVLRSKGNDITAEEAEAVITAILLHDIGHGPFSHSLEYSIVEGISHEFISSLFMNRLNEYFKGDITLAIEIFNNRYYKKFLHQLITSELDVDRLDYLKRDSFYTGVHEGAISFKRIILMLNVVNNELVVEEKGLASLEKFITARRFMYWQVYLHKTVVSAQQLLINILKKAKELSRNHGNIFTTPALSYFLSNQITKENFLTSEETFNCFSMLDDFDINYSVKLCTTHPDKVLSILSQNLLRRNLYKIEIQNEPFNKNIVELHKDEVKLRLSLNEKEIDYFVFTGNLRNEAYNSNGDKIKILLRNGSLVDMENTSDNINIKALSKPVEKYYLCCPKELSN